MKVVFKCSYETISKMFELNWYDIYFAIINDIFNCRDAITHALNKISEQDEETSDIYRLLLTDENETEKIRNHVMRLSKSEDNNSEEKWVYILIKYMFHNINDYSNLWELSVSMLSKFSCENIPSELQEILLYQLSNQCIKVCFEKYIRRYEEKYMVSS